ncbi:hypothetical protein VNO77_23325 [Canavalia gladiata]|uniref:Uncharacterized protein n=1 Tax=Canavalia gladiata TaxID=3824 RepID=A0AAN9L481_CANGL
MGGGPIGNICYWEMVIWLLARRAWPMAVPAVASSRIQTDGRRLEHPLTFLPPTAMILRVIGAPPTQFPWVLLGRQPSFLRVPPRMGIVISTSSSVGDIPVLGLLGFAGTILVFVPNFERPQSFGTALMAGVGAPVASRHGDFLPMADRKGRFVFGVWDRGLQQWARPMVDLEHASLWCVAYLDGELGLQIGDVLGPLKLAMAQSRSGATILLVAVPRAETDFGWPLLIL